jgi:uncharacterized Zn-finger protein
MTERKPNTRREVEIGPQDLPLQCPMPDMLQWNAHPRVFLKPGPDGKVLCPYCSTRYTLSGGKPEHQH